MIDGVKIKIISLLVAEFVPVEGGLLLRYADRDPVFGRRELVAVGDAAGVAVEAAAGGDVVAEEAVAEGEPELEEGECAVCIRHGFAG